ncbi:hypothetical protein AXG93_509s1110 [Marchantia polymorpha subsp. ruderalis]|uniref:Uncharacterized protein n=1 Tax=Marchantia polymorpha subsp. ruderalis TaxID=1480154 RepID=A0A176W9F1_MARPO|nr:hypothetical protein AXG93_509s1110 [Marchantia polymorpha subsp. ruderalis]
MDTGKVGHEAPPTPPTHSPSQSTRAMGASTQIANCCRARRKRSGRVRAVRSALHKRDRWDLSGRQSSTQTLDWSVKLHPHDDDGAAREWSDLDVSKAPNLDDDSIIES